ncbi:MAG: alpha/beta hydrolase [Rhodobacteraceae bacterium]|nr:alpha/beta hydrolase [Paracoccaceae bacterium]
MTWTKLVALSLVLAAAAGGFAYYVNGRVAAQAAAAEDAFPPEGELIEVNGTTVHAVVRGSGPDLVLIHGASGNTRDFTFDLVGRLSDRYRVIALDRPGFGYTDRLGRGSESINDQAILLQAAAAHLGAEKPIVLGQSYGGAVAMAWAVERPDKLSGLVMVAGVSNPWVGGVDTLYHVLGSRPGSALLVPLVSAYYGRERVLDAVRGVFSPQLPPDGYAEYIGTGLTLRPQSLRANAQQRITLEREITELVPRYEAVDVPAELVHGTADGIVAHVVHSIPLSRQLDDANLVALNGVGHMPHHTHTEAVIAAIDRVAGRAGLR